MTEKCTAQHLLDYDSLYCHLEDGHAGPHRDRGNETGPVWWQTDRMPQRGRREDMKRRRP